MTEFPLDRDKSYGLVLEGGGARGAYQIGAWKALREAGISISAVAGTSVGALNGALICMDDLELAENIWKNISRSQVMDVEGGLRGFIRTVKNGGLDVTPLRRLIEESVDETRIRNSHKELYAVTYSLKDHAPLVVDIKRLPEGEMARMLLASAYLPGFKREAQGEERYFDGCLANNVPVDVLIDRGYKDIIVIRIYGQGVDTEKHLAIPEDVRLYHVAPRVSLGGILKFDGKRARRNMALGYSDASGVLRKPACAP